MGILKLERAFLVTPEGDEELLHDLASQWLRTERHETLTFHALRDRLLVLEGKKRQVDAAQMGEVLMHALMLIGRSLFINPRGTMALLAEYRARAAEEAQRDGRAESEG